jgi:hypothetical protein
MGIERITITEERSELLDRILLSASATNRIVTLPIESQSDKNDYISAGKELQQLGLGKHLAEGDFMVFPEGLSFIREQTFTDLYKAKLRQIRNQKIEFWLKLIGGIAAIFGIIFGFVKSCS